MPAKFKALIFDAYGTLFDVHSVVQLGDTLFPGRGAELSRLWRTKQLEYTWLRSLMGHYADFSAVTRAALEHACKTLDLGLEGDTADRMMAAYTNLALFPDARDALAGLHDLKLAILSNGSPAMLHPLVRNAGLDAVITTVISVDEMRIYKPDPRVYQLAVDRLGFRKEEIAFVSSNYWDAAGARNFGFHVFWINRTGAHPDALGSVPDRTLAKLTELSEHLR